MTLELQAPLYMHLPFEQSREVVLIHALLGDHAKVGGQQWQRDGQQVWFTAQTVAEHPIGYQAHQMDLWGQSDVCNDQNPFVVCSHPAGLGNSGFHLVCVYQQVLFDSVQHPPHIRLQLCLPLFPGQWEGMIVTVKQTGASLKCKNVQICMHWLFEMLNEC